MAAMHGAGFSLALQLGCIHVLISIRNAQCGQAGESRQLAVQMGWEARQHLSHLCCNRLAQARLRSDIRGSVCLSCAMLLRCTSLDYGLGMDEHW